ncbi:MAG: hypothetical protein ACRYG4_11440 [Janthinobacterium lividum]
MPDKPELPPELQASVRRHQEHLGALIINLRAAGVDEGVIATSVQQLMTSYGMELTGAIQSVVLGYRNG